MKKIILSEIVFSKLETLLEKRRNPDVNNYESNVKREIQNVLNNITSDLDNIFFSFRDGHHVTSINLKSMYGHTPNGLYCYPLSRFKTKIISGLKDILEGNGYVDLEKMFSEIVPWLPPNTSTVYFFKQVGGTIYNVEDNLNIDKLLKILGNYNKHLKPSGVNIIQNAIKKENPSDYFMNTVEAYARSAVQSSDYAKVYGFLYNHARNHKHASKIFRLLGYDGIFDFGNGIIHLFIYTQCVFFTPRKHLKMMGQITIGKARLTKNNIDKYLKEFPENRADLDLSERGLVKIPEAVFSLKYLGDINLSFNKISKIPKSITKLSWLTDLDFTNNEITHIPSEIASLSLRRLFLDENKLREFPLPLTKIKSLMKLYLGNNNIKEIPSEITKLTNLKILSLNDCNITQNGLEYIGKLPFLERLNLYGNKGITNIPNTFMNLNYFSALDLRGTSVNKNDKLIEKLKKQGVTVYI